MTEFNISAINDVIHGRLRLGIMAYLSSTNSATFNELKDRLEATQGNLSVQLRNLEDAGYVTISRRIKGRKTEMIVQITKAGISAFADYVEAISALVGKT